MHIRVAADPPTAAATAAALIARRIRAAAALRERVGFAVSGGSTPALMFAALAGMSVPWTQLDVYQVDERVAPDGDPARNLGLLEAFAERGARVVAMAVSAVDVRRAAARYASRLPDWLDVVHLGVGDDGHTASWPPGDPVVDAPTLVAVSGRYRGHVRMTITPAVVNRARSRVVLATGADKAAPIERWLLGDPGVPVQRVRRTGTTIVLDEAAAALLQPSVTRDVVR